MKEITIKLLPYETILKAYEVTLSVEDRDFYFCIALTNKDRVFMVSPDSGAHELKESAAKIIVKNPENFN